VIVSAAAPPPLGIAHFTTIGVEPMALVEMAARIGYAAVGLRLYPAFPGAPFYQIPAGSAAMRAMRGLLAATAISVYDIEFVTIDESLDVEILKPVLESAAELGAQRLSVCGDDPDRSRFAATLARLCDMADAFNLGIDLEVMPWRRISTVAIAWDAIQQAARPNAGILIDALHLSRSGGAPEDLRTLPKDVIRSAQLCDAVSSRPATTQAHLQEARAGRLLPGEGALPLHRMIGELPDHVMLSVEVPNAVDPPEDHARRVYDAARRILSAHGSAGI
jgi:sugar phosphate isomerase/epimerase